MGMYNTLIADTLCSQCGREIVLNVQFKYGDLRLYEYSLGDAIRWSNVDEDKSEIKLAVLDCTAEDCVYCGGSDDAFNDYLIYVEYGIIKSFKKSSGEYNFFDIDEDYIVLEP